jgi:hypothetical protein
MIGSTPGAPALHRPDHDDMEDDMALDDDDMTTPAEPRDSGTPADRAEGTMPEGQYLGRDSGADLEADGAADGGADSGAEGPGSGAGDDDPTTETDEDSRFA